MESLVLPVGPVPVAKVLIVEDQPDAAASLELLLRTYGYDVCVRHSGLQGLEAARIYKPNIALLDIGLPKMDGWQLASCIRAELGAERPVLIAVTGYGSDEDRRQSLQAGFDHHLLKTVSPAELMDLLGEIVRTLPQGVSTAMIPDRQKDSGGPTPQVPPGVRVLIVEDNEDAACILETLLHLQGYDVKVAFRGMTGVETAVAYKPHIAILDIGLPDIDGWEVARRLQNHLQDCRPVLIALTGYGSEEHRAKSAAAGFDHHLLKSMSSDELLGLLSQAARIMVTPRCN